MKMKKKTLAPAKKLYLALVVIMAILAIIAIISVKSLLVRYENCQPERRVEELIDEWKVAARAGTVWDTLDFPAVTANEYEPIDLQEAYTKALASGLLDASMVPGSQTEDGRRTYAVKTDDGQTIAEVELQSVGEPEVYLAVFTLQDWVVTDAGVTVKPQTYTVEAPDDLSVTLNGIELGEAERTLGADGFARYTVDGLCMIPEVRVKTAEGQSVKMHRSGTKFRAEVYSYSLTLPAALRVTIDGVEAAGEALTDGTVRYRAFSETKPEVILYDRYGNSVLYEAGEAVPLTACTLTVDDSSIVLVNGKVTDPTLGLPIDHPDRDLLIPYIGGVPTYMKYDIAVLDDNASVSVRSVTGQVHELGTPQGEIDLTDEPTGLELPPDIAAEINVLKAVETWSLFMSTDLDGEYYGIYEITPYLIKGSALYDQAYHWINNIDITFISIHTLADPAFTNESVTNYRRLTENCFYCDVRFDKNMLISGNGWEPLVDTMNTRVCFVLSDGVWKMLQMKEIVA